VKTNTHSKVYQNQTLITAIHAGSEWTHAELSTMAALKEAGSKVTEIAEILGRSYYAVTCKLNAAGLTTPQRNPNPRAAKEEPSYGELCHDCFLIHQGECA
jgi:hypothetical protein